MFRAAWSEEKERDRRIGKIEFENERRQLQETRQPKVLPANATARAT